MNRETTDTLIIGAGQAGIAMSEHLGNHGIAHLVLERRRIAERWRSERWDSLVANGPAWHDRFPNREFSSCGPDDFASKEAVADYLVAYAGQVKAPVCCGVEVKKLEKIEGQPGFRALTNEGEIEARAVVVATGPFQVPVIPPIVPKDMGITQMHSSQYRNPAQLAEGAVLVVGAGSSGVQIADELHRAGKEVYLSVGPHDRPPRAYRGRDFVWWLGVLGKWDAAASPQGNEHVTISVSGAYGGHTIDFRRLANRGMALAGRTQGCKMGVVHFAPDLAENIKKGDAYYLSLLAEADAYIARNGLDLPPEPGAHILQPEPECMRDPLLKLDLAGADVKSIIWATGFKADYRWMELDVLDKEGRPLHQRGISPEAGIYFLGLPWQSRRGSSFLWGVWHDAKFIADQIAIQQAYQNFRPSVRR